MGKTEFEKIKEQQKKARNKEILYRVKEIFKYKGEAVNEILLDIVTQLHVYGYLYPKDLVKHLLPGYTIIEKDTGKEVTNNE